MRGPNAAVPPSPSRPSRGQPPKTPSSPRRLPSLPPSAESPRLQRRKKKKKTQPPPQPPSAAAAAPTDEAWDEVDGALPSLDFSPLALSPSPTLRNSPASEFPFPPPPGFCTPRSRLPSTDPDSPFFDKRKDPLLRHRASAQHRQAVLEVMHHQRWLREMERQRQSVSHCILEEAEESEGFDIGPVPGPSSARAPGTAPEGSQGASNKAVDRWHLIRDKLDEVRTERASSKSAQGWNMFVKHVKAVSDMEKARQDLYSRYGLGRGEGGSASARGRNTARVTFATDSPEPRTDSPGPRIHSVNF